MMRHVICAPVGVQTMLGRRCALFLASWAQQEQRERACVPRVMSNVVPMSHVSRHVESGRAHARMRDGDGCILFAVVECGRLYSVRLN